MNNITRTQAILTEGYENKILSLLDDHGIDDAWFENSILYVTSKEDAEKAKEIIDKDRDIFRTPKIKVESIGVLVAMKEGRDPVAPKGSTGKEPHTTPKEMEAVDVKVGDWIKNGGHFYEVWSVSHSSGSYCWLVIGIMDKETNEVWYRETVQQLKSKKLMVKHPK